MNCVRSRAKKIISGGHLIDTKNPITCAQVCGRVQLDALAKESFVSLT